MLVWEPVDCNLVIVNVFVQVLVCEPVDCNLVMLNFFSCFCLLSSWLQFWNFTILILFPHFACLQWFDMEYKLSALYTWSKRHNFKHCKITWKQAFLKIVHGYVKRNRYNIDKAFYILMKLCNNFFTKITNITWCNRNNINVAFMCNRALIWMPLWVEFWCFLHSNDRPEQYGENAYRRMQMWIVF